MLSLTHLIERPRHVAHQIKSAYGSRQWPKRPESINFEITAACDSKCIHCPRLDMDRKMCAMDFDLFKRMVDQAAEMRVPNLCPNGYGELLVLKDVERYLEYIASKSHPFRININTNGHRMDDDKIEMFFKYRVRSLNIVIDGATKETAESIRVGLDFDRIEGNIHRLLAMRSERGLTYPKLRVGMIQIKQNQHESEQFIDRWTGVADFVGMAGASNRAGSLVQIGSAYSGPAHPCVLPFSEMNVWADGKVALCCEDWNEEHVVGDLNHESVAQVWSGPRLTEVREKHMQSCGAEIPICQKCNYWRKPIAGTKLWS